MTVGMLRNNPFNLEVRHVPWKGLSAEQPESGPLQFETLEYGLRAGIKAIWHLYDQGENTPLRFITKWAPPQDNPTAQYIENLCAWCNVAFTDRIDLHDDDFLIQWANGLIRQEQGNEIVISEAALRQAIADARE